MATTYTLISSTVLTSTEASVTFSSIPATYTDLRVVLVSTIQTAADYIEITFNGSTFFFTYCYYLKLLHQIIKCNKLN